MLTGHYAIEDFIPLEIFDQLKVMQEDLYYQFIVDFAERGWPLMDKFNSLVSIWHSSGFNSYAEWDIFAKYTDIQIQNKVWASASNSFHNVGPIKLSFENTAGILMMWVIGMAISMLCFGAELLWAYVVASRDAGGKIYFY